MFFLTLVGSALLAVRNLRLGLGDRKGAFRLALFVFAVSLLGGLSGSHHVATQAEFYVFLKVMERGTHAACLLWLIYIALEPFVRRRWPERIVSWSRLLAGDFRDPLVNRDFLIGALSGVGVTLYNFLFHFARGWIGGSPVKPRTNSPADTNLGMGYFGIAFSEQLVLSLLISLAFLFLLTLLSILLRSDKLSVFAVWLVFTAVHALVGGNTLVSWVGAAGMSALTTVVIYRYGLLAMFAAQVFFHLFIYFPATVHFSAWYTTGFIIALVVLVALAAYSFHKSSAGQPLFRGGFLKIEGGD